MNLNRGFDPEISYSFDILAQLLGLKYKELFKLEDLDTLSQESVLISYGEFKPEISGPKHLHIYESGFFGPGYLKPGSVPSPPRPRYDDVPVILLNEWQNPEPFVNLTSGGSIETNIDIIASTFFMVSRYEEVVAETDYERGRFPTSCSLALRDNFLTRPIVNEYAELLWGWLKALRPGLERRTPGYSPLLICDVESARMYSVSGVLSRSLRALIEGRPLRAISHLTRGALSLSGAAKDPYDTFGLIIDAAHRYGLEPIFFLKSHVSSRDSRRLIELLNERGYKVGLHCGDYAYLDRELLSQELSELQMRAGQPIEICITARWENPTTWRVMEEAGIKADYSLGFPDRPGFRCGICAPYNPFDIKRRRRMSLVEVPLAATDSALNNMGLEPDLAQRVLRDLIIQTRKYSGTFALLWHNSSFEPEGWKGWDRLFLSALEAMTQ